MLPSCQHGAGMKASCGVDVLSVGLFTSALVLKRSIAQLTQLESILKPLGRKEAERLNNSANSLGRTHAVD